MTFRHSHAAADRAVAFVVASVADEADTLTRPAVTDEGDHDKFAHYVRKSDIASSAVNGHEVVAICGKRWVPTRVPDNFPVCPDCKKIYEQLNPTG